MRCGSSYGRGTLPEFIDSLHGGPHDTEAVLCLLPSGSYFLPERLEYSHLRIKDWFFRKVRTCGVSSFFLLSISILLSLRHLS